MNYKTLLLVYILKIFYLVLPLGAISQNENNNWYFGYKAGITFQQDTVSALLNNAFTTDLVESAYSDPKTGNLLFYTNGTHIMNKNHEMMNNGSFIWQMAENNLNSSLIVPVKCNPNIFYVFSNDYRKPPSGGQQGLAYSIVDMSLNGGLGKVITKSIKLLGSTTAQMEGVLHANGSDAWIIAHKLNSEDFYAYHVTATGITDTVISTVGPLLDDVKNEWPLVANMQGTMLAMAWENREMLLFDFDNKTGQIKERKEWTSASIISAVHGYCFSPNGKLFYWVNSGNPISYFQYDITAEDIASSEILLGNNSLGAYGVSSYLQIGPDGRIYSSPSGGFFLDIINKPDIKGEGCDIEFGKISLGGNQGHGFLPNFISQSYVHTNFNTQQNCSSQIVEFVDQSDNLILSQYSIPILEPKYRWDFGDESTDTTKNPIHSYQSEGIYQVSLIVTDRCRADTIIKEVEVYGPCSIYIPNAFSPNGDGINDFFEISNSRFEWMSLQIFDRRGNAIYEVSGEMQSVNWDGISKGKVVNEGVYSYILLAKERIEHNPIQIKGNISSIR